MFFYSTMLFPVKLGTYITHNATGPSTVQAEIQACYNSSSSEPLASSRDAKRTSFWPFLFYFIFLNCSFQPQMTSLEAIYHISCIYLWSHTKLLFCFTFAIILPSNRLWRVKLVAFPCVWGRSVTLTCHPSRGRQWPHSQETPWQPEQVRCSRGQWVYPHRGTPAARP